MYHLCAQLEVSLVRLRVPHALGIYRDGVFADFEIVGGLERYVDDTCRGAKEVGILASLVEGEGSTYTSVNFPSLLFIDRIFGIDEGGILLVLIVARTVSTEDDGGPTQGKRKFLLVEMICQGGIEETTRGVGGIVPILMIIIVGSWREVVGVSESEAPSACLEIEVMVELLVRTLRVGSSPKSHGHMVVSHRITEVGEQDNAIRHFHATPKMIVLNVGFEMKLCLGISQTRSHQQNNN